MSIYELVNTETEQVEAEQLMEAAEAAQRNTALRSSNEPQRWVRQTPSDAQEVQS